ncbi:MAG: FAD-dependent monooxygenase [Aestuariivita sp.]|nr:FAD-dependent monooxygenase [Aestuariivita sp.]
MSLHGLEVRVIGGGIGGFAIATILAQRGAKVKLFEQSAALREVGAGLQISANGQCVLKAMSLLDQINHYVSSGTKLIDGYSGRTLSVVRSPRTGNTWYVYRPDLLQALQVAALKVGVFVELDQQVTPKTFDNQRHVDLIVAADGGRSLWRTFVDGPTAQKFSRKLVWRALVNCESPIAVGESANLVMNNRSHIVTYPIQQGKLMNIVAVESRRNWASESWNQVGDPEEFRNTFANFKGVTEQWISAAKKVHLSALHVRPVVRHWYRDNVALLGDSAHPTLPFMAQGACLALEDAWILSDALDQTGSVWRGLQLYQSVRWQRVKKVVELARRNAFLFHLSRPWNLGTQLIMRMGSNTLAQRMEWVYEYNATNAISSLLERSKSS